MRQPSERQKMLNERRAKTFEKHAVRSVAPLKNFSEMDIHEELDKQGSGVKESMIANEELQRANKKIKDAKQKPIKDKIIKERIEKLEERDKKNGRLEEGRKFAAKQRKKARKKK